MSLPAHAKLSPSSASGWMTCADYVNANEGLPDDVSEFAAEGTVAHHVSDLCLTIGFEPFDFIGMVMESDGYTIKFDEEMAEALQPGIDWVREQPGTFYSEHRVDLSHWLGPNQFGTLDRGLVAPDLITINDLKFGRGIPVSPVRNKQLMIYAAGFWRNVARHVSKATQFRLVIDQPRCTGGGGEWFCTLDELLEFMEEAKAAAVRTRLPETPRTASKDGCMWCRRKIAPGGCDTYDEFNLDLIGQKFEDLDDDGPLVMPRALTPGRRSKVLLHAKVIEKWLEHLHIECLNDALRGDPTDGLKAVEGRKTPDKWADKVKADASLGALLGVDRFTKMLISPTQVGKKVSPLDLIELEPLIERGTKKPILVPAEDAREAIAPIESKFDDVEDEE